MSKMDNSAACKIKMFISSSAYAIITLLLTTTIDLSNNIKREGSVKLCSRQTSDIIMLSLSEMQQLLEKFNQSQFDGIIALSDWLTPLPTAAAIESILLYMHDCGEFFYSSSKK